MKRFLPLALLIGFVFLNPFPVKAQEKYPARAIELVVPFGPGGATSIVARAYSENLSKFLKVPVNVVNREGGTGVQGTSYVIRSKKDGYTLLSTTDTPLVVMPVISKEVTYDPMEDVIPIGYIGYAPSVFAVKSDSPFKTLSELLDYARQNPGKLKNGISGFGTEAYFNLQLLCLKEKLKITSIPFKSGADVTAMLLAGPHGYGVKRTGVLEPAAQGRGAPRARHLIQEASR